MSKKNQICLTGILNGMNLTKHEDSDKEGFRAFIMIKKKGRISEQFPELFGVIKQICVSNNIKLLEVVTSVFRDGDKIVQAEIENQQISGESSDIPEYIKVQAGHYIIKVKSKLNVEVAFGYKKNGCKVKKTLEPEVYDEYRGGACLVKFTPRFYMSPDKSKKGISLYVSSLILATKMQPGYEALAFSASSPILDEEIPDDFLSELPEPPVIEQQAQVVGFEDDDIPF